MLELKHPKTTTIFLAIPLSKAQRPAHSKATYPGLSLFRVRGLAFSPNGKMMASPSEDGMMLLDSARGATRHMLEGQSSKHRAQAFSPDGKLVASGSADETVRL